MHGKFSLVNSAIESAFLLKRAYPSPGRGGGACIIAVCSCALVFCNRLRKVGQLVVGIERFPPHPEHGFCITGGCSREIFTSIFLDAVVICRGGTLFKEIILRDVDF